MSFATSIKSCLHCSSGLSLGFIILIAVGGAILLIGIIVMLAILFVRSRRRNERHSRVVEARETKEHPYWIKDNKQVGLSFIRTLSRSTIKLTL